MARAKRATARKPATKKEAKNESDVGDVESTMDVDDIRRDIENKCNALQAFCDDATLALRSELKIQLLKMPKKVRSMPLKEFLSKFAGDINKVILDELNARWFTTMEDVQAADYPAGSRTGLKRQPQTVAKRGRKKASAAPATVMATRTTQKRLRDAANASEDDGASVRGCETTRITRSRARTSLAQSQASAMPMQTPAPTRGRGASAQQARQPFTPLVANTLPASMAANTVLRNPKRGEVFFSKNGSPLGMCAEAGEAEDPDACLVTPMVAGFQPKSTAKACATVRCRKTRTGRKPAGRGAGADDGGNGGLKEALSPEDLQILLTNEDGEEIALGGDTENNVEDLQGDMRNFAIGKLMGLQNKVMSMLASLGQQ